MSYYQVVTVFGLWNYRSEFQHLYWGYGFQAFFDLLCITRHDDDQLVIVALLMTRSYVLVILVMALETKGLRMHHAPSLNIGGVPSMGRSRSGPICAGK